MINLKKEEGKMAKKTRKVSKQQYPVEFPEVVNMDVLAYYSDDELKQRNYTLRSEEHTSELQSH